MCKGQTFSMVSQDCILEITNPEPRNRGMQRGKAPATSYQLMVSGRVVARGVEKERASLANAYDGFHINSGATYCIVNRVIPVGSPA